MAFGYSSAVLLFDLVVPNYPQVAKFFSETGLEDFKKRYNQQVVSWCNLSHASYVREILVTETTIL